MGRWSQSKRKGGSHGEYRQARVTSAIVTQDSPGASVDFNCVIAPAPDKSVLFIYDAAAPTVAVATGTGGAVTTPGVSYATPIVGHSYFGKVQTYRGPYVSQLVQSNTLVAT